MYVSEAKTAIQAVEDILNDVDAKRIVATDNYQLARYIVQNICAHQWHTIIDGIVFKSNPPRYGRVCLVCEKTDSISVEDYHEEDDDNCE